VTRLYPKPPAPDIDPLEDHVFWQGGGDLSLMAMCVMAIWTGSVLGIVVGLVAWLVFDGPFLMTFAVIWIITFIIGMLPRATAPGT